MRQIVNLSAADTVPTTEGVCGRRVLPDSVTPDNRVLELAAIAADIYLQLATPMGLLAEIDGDDFAHVFNAAALNNGSPAGPLYRKAEALALFTVTTGENLGTEISHLFEVNELPLASMLDATASEGTELAADIIEDHSVIARGNRPDKSVNRSDEIQPRLLRLAPERPAGTVPLP